MSCGMIRIVAGFCIVAAVGCEEAQVPLVLPPERQSPRTTAPPSFPDGAELTLLRASTWEVHCPAAQDDEGIEAYLVLLNGQEIARVDPDRTGYDVGIPSEARAYTIVARDAEGGEASLDLALPPTEDGRFALQDEINQRLARRSESLRFQSAGPAEQLVDVLAVRGHVTVGPREVPASASTEAVVRTLRRRVAAMRRCFERLLRSNPRLGGRVGVRIAIAASGRVSSVDVAQSPSEERITDCVLSTVRRTRFAEDPATYAVNIDFAPDN